MKLLRLLLTALLLLTAPAVLGDERTGEVRVGSRTLFTVQGGLRETTASERSNLIHQRLERILRDPATDPAKVRVGMLPEGLHGVFLGEELLVRVLPEDAEAARSTPQALAQRWATTLRASIKQLQPLYARERLVSARTLSEHHVLLLLVQVAALLLLARLCGALAQRLGQPAVIGQLLAGVLLGRSFFGAVLPEVKALIFPVEGTQSYLLEVVSWLGVLFLLLLTGLETDTDLIRRKGRLAVGISVAGVVLPFGLGFGTGMALPESLLTTPESRLVLALFLGTALSISSVPVISRILREMGLLRRDVGQLILAVALTDDTIGWIVLALIARLAVTNTFDGGVLARTVVGTALFLGLALTLGRRGVRATLGWFERRSGLDYGILTASVVLMLAGAATTQAIGIHPLLGAFTVGVLLREHPKVWDEVFHPLETVTTGIFAPIFFSAAGLHVSLGVLSRPELLGILIVLLAAASVGKIGGGYLAARAGRVSQWGALCVGFGINARGAMGLIVGILGFSLGILTVELFSMVILMALFTTASTPPLLRWALQKQEREREALQIAA